MSSNIGIYKITNKDNGKIYIGQSRNLHERILEHKRKLFINKHNNIHLQRAYNKYGVDSFSFEVIEHCETETLTAREIFWINSYNSHVRDHGYNIDMPNVEDSSLALSDETKRKISEANLKYGDKDELISYLQEFFYLEGRTPTQHDFIVSKNNNYPSYTIFYNQFGSFKNALIEADLYDFVKNKKIYERVAYTKETILDKFRVFIAKYGDFPNYIERAEASKYDLPSSAAISKYWVSIDNIREALGCKKELVNDEENQEALSGLRKLYERDSYITSRTISESPLTRSVYFYTTRFGSLNTAYDLVGIPHRQTK